MPHPVTPSRRVAYEVLQAAASGAYASDLLLTHTAALDSRDAGLASQLVFGCLRFRAQLDFLISRYSGRSLANFEEPVLILLRLGIFQLRYLDRVPVHAAVNETVELAKIHRRAASGLVNAVLRKVRRGPVDWPDRATALSCPEWLLARWDRHFGPQRSAAIARAALDEPVRYLRIPPGQPAPPGVELAPTALPGCWRITGGDGRNVRLQDIGSQTLVPQLALESRHTFLDLCAAPGNKTLQAHELCPRAVACDISFKRLSEVPPVCPRVLLDAARPLPFRRPFDRILIDAPCSGTGTLGRNPEIKWRVQPDDFARFAARQVAILVEGMRILAPGGRLLYATCSLEQEENEAVVAQALTAVPGLRLLGQSWRIPGSEEGDGFYAAVITSSK